MDVIVNSDDFGNSQNVNDAVDYSIKHGMINRTTALMSRDFVQDAVDEAQTGGYLDKVGLHLNLDAGPSLTKEISKYGLISLKGTAPFWNNRINHFFILDKKVKRAIAAEVEAQMKRYIELGFTAMHIDSHHHRHCIPSILAIVIPLAKKYGFRSMRLSRNMGPGIYGFKQIVKHYVNKRIKQNFITTEYFGSYSDWCYAGKPQNAEIMVHAKIIDGEYVDVPSKVLLSKIQSSITNSSKTKINECESF